MTTEDQAMMQFAYYGITRPEDEMEANSTEIIEYLSPDEEKTLDFLEHRMETALNIHTAASITLATCLKQIHEQRLYKKHGTFENYCQERWQRGRRWGYQLIEAAQTINLLATDENVRNCAQPENEAQVRPLTKLEPEQQKEAWQKAVETAPNGKVTAVHVEHVVNNYFYTPPVSPVIEQPPKPVVMEMSQELQVLLSHETTEWYTPPEYIELAKLVMGDIDLDPASCQAAQEWIQAKQFYTILDNGLAQEWHGRMWLNPPYSTTEGQSNQELWSQKLVTQYGVGNVTEAILLVKASFGYNWFDNLFDLFPVCIMKGLISFIKSDGQPGGKAKLGSAFFYFGDNFEQFEKIFSSIGWVFPANK